MKPIEEMSLDELRAEVAELRRDAETLPLLVKIAAREQRYVCVHSVLMEAEITRLSPLIQNAKCPSVATVLQNWRNQRTQETE